MLPAINKNLKKVKGIRYLDYPYPAMSFS